MLKVRRWDCEIDGPMTEANIRRKHAPPPPRRVSRDRYEPGDGFEGISRAALVHVTEGRVSFEHEGGQLLFSEGEVLSFDGGRYFVRNDGTVAAAAYWVWVIPTESC